MYIYWLKKMPFRTKSAHFVAKNGGFELGRSLSSIN